jgi:hypothetical protein
MESGQFRLLKHTLLCKTAANLSHLKGVGEAIMKDMVEFARYNLRGGGESLKRGRVKNDVPVALEIVPVIPLAALLFEEPLNTF